MFGAFDGAELVGYGINEPNTGDIPQLAVAPKHRRRGIENAGSSFCCGICKGGECMGELYNTERVSGECWLRARRGTARDAHGSVA